MATTAPAAGDTIKVVDQSSEYRNKTGTVVSVNTAAQTLVVKFSDSHKNTNLRLTQIGVIGTANGAEVATRKVGNNPGGTVQYKTDSRYTPKNNERRDYSGAGYNPSDPTGTLNDSRPKLA